MATDFVFIYEAVFRLALSSYETKFLKTELIFTVSIPNLYIGSLGAIYPDDVPRWRDHHTKTGELIVLQEMKMFKK